MGIHIHRVGTRVMHIGAGGVQVIHPRSAAAAWWMAGGVIPIAAYQAKGAATYAASKVNLANPGTYDLTEGNGAVPWATGTGWGFVAASAQWLDTGVVPTLDQTWSAFVQYSGMTVIVFAILMGSYKSTVPSGTLLITTPASGMRVFHGAIATYATTAPWLLTGNYGVAGTIPYRDGIAEPNTVPASSGTTNLSLYIGAANADGAAVSFCTATLRAVVLYSSVLTPAQSLAIATAMAAL